MCSGKQLCELPGFPSHHLPTDQASLHLDEKNASCMGEQVIQLVDRSENPVIGKNGLPTTLRGAKGGPGDGDGMSWGCQ
jgi:hypothetical protein